MSSTVGKEEPQMNKKNMLIGLGVCGGLLVVMLIAVLCTGGFTSPF